MKLFLDERGRPEVASAVDASELQTSSSITYVECVAALARAGRSGRVRGRDVERAAELLETTWVNVAAVDVDDDVVQLAAGAAREHPVRAADALHLGSALAIGGPEADVTFACFDRRLWEAAGELGFARVPGSL